MNLLIDIGHPAHVHLYRNFYFEMLNKGHSILVTTKDLAPAKSLLELYKIPYILFPKKSDAICGKIFRQLIFDFRQYQNVKLHNIEVGFGTSITNAHVSRVTKMKSIIMDDDDDEVQPLFVKYAHPYADCILSPDVLYGKRKNRSTFYYPGYHELAYLHPNRFKPDKTVLEELKLRAEDKFFIMRFNAFKAHHDLGISGLSLDQKLLLVKHLSSKGKVFITTEREIEPELEKHKLKISQDKIHSLLFFATLFIGDSQTMTSEAAVLGTPALRLNSFTGRISYLEEQEHKYGLTFGFKPDNFDLLVKKMEELLANPNIKEEWKQKKDKMLNDKIDVTSFMVWFIETYPNSREIMRDGEWLLNNFK